MRLYHTLRSRTLPGYLLMAACGVQALLTGEASAFQAPVRTQIRDPFQVFWCTTTDGGEVRNGNKWSEKVDFAGLPIRKDAVLLYEPWLGEYPKAGPHMMLLDPQLMARHMAKISTDLDRYVPKDFAGLAVIDYEAWRPLWERNVAVPSNLPANATDQDFQDDWRETIRQLRPELVAGLSTEQAEAVFKSTYEKQVKDFLLPTLKECKRLRPNAKWSFYGFPEGFYTGNNQTARGVFGYGDGSYRASKLNDTLDWLWKEIDFVAPDIYASHFTRTDGAPRNARENTPEENRLFIVNNISEYRRVAAGKPVYPFVWFRYHDVMGPPMALDWVNRVNLDDQVVQSARSGCEGVIIWEHFGGSWDRFTGSQLRDHYSQKFGAEFGESIRTAIASRNEMLGVKGEESSEGATSSGTTTVVSLAPTVSGNSPSGASGNKPSGSAGASRADAGKRVVVRAVSRPMSAQNRQQLRIDHSAIMAALKRAKAGSAPLAPPKTTPSPAAVASVNGD